MKILRLLTISLITGIVHAPPPRKRGCRKALSGVNFRIRNDNVIDLTHVFNESSVYWPSNPSGFKLTELVRGVITYPAKMFVYYNMMSQPEHIGTHMDAPIHFSQEGLALDQLEVFNLVGNGVLVNLKQGEERFDSDGYITIDHFLKWEREHSERIRSGSIVILYTGHADVYYDSVQYMGTNLTGEEAIPYLQFPGLNPEAAEWLVSHRCIGGIGIDTMGIDHSKTSSFGSHIIFSRNNIPIYENVGNLDKLAASGKDFTIVALPQKIEGASGAPVRMIAVLN